MINSKNIFYHELINLKVKVTDSPNKSLIGIKGRVIDETKKTLKLECEDGEKLIPKNVSIFHFKLPSGECVEIDGRILLSRPEERIKKRFKKIK